MTPVTRRAASGGALWVPHARDLPRLFLQFLGSNPPQEFRWSQERSLLTDHEGYQVLFIAADTAVMFDAGLISIVFQRGHVPA